MQYFRRLLILSLITLVAYAASSASVVRAQTAAPSTLIDGSSLTRNTCYSTSSNLRTAQIKVSSPPNAAINMINLGSGPKMTITCIDVIEVMSGVSVSDPSNLCSARTSLQICYGPLGSPPLQHTNCRDITTFYTAPKTTITVGSIQGDDLEWSMKYDGRVYSDFCFPRVAQIVVYAQIDSPGQGSVAILVIAIIIVVLVISCGVWYFFYQQSRQTAKMDFDAATNVMPPAHPDADGEIENDGMGPDGGGEPRMIEMMGDEGSFDRGVMDGGEIDQNHSPRQFVNDGPAIFAMGPIASIYGTDVREDAFSIPRGGGGIEGGGGGGGASTSRGIKSPSKRPYRIMPEVNTCPLPPIMDGDIGGRQAGLTRASELVPSRVEPSASASRASEAPSSSVGHQDRVTLCADCGAEIESDSCPQTCEVTGLAHY